MTSIIIIAIILLLAIVVVQIGRVSELSARIRGEEEIELRNNRAQGIWLFIFMIVFLVLCVASGLYFKNYMLGYGPHTAASEHGTKLDDLFNVTLFFTAIVFVLTHIALFYFAYKYHGRKGLKASFLAHNNTLEIFWALIPALVMTFLVARGLVVWNDVMADISEVEPYMEVEAMGYQFAWNLRYPGSDGALGARDFRLVSALNPVGQDWTDVKNLDDFQPSELVLPVNRKIRVRIIARDVLHNFYLPHFRVKMDAVPGLPTYFVFTPTKTTEEYRQELSNYPEYNVPANPDEPDGPLKWETFKYELACAELCGKGHYSMQKTVRIVSEEEYDAWEAQQSSYYIHNIRGKEADPFIDQVLDFELKDRRESLASAFERAMSDTSASPEKTIPLNYVYFKEETSELQHRSEFELENLVDILNRFPETIIEIASHTDNLGEAENNQRLSQNRAEAVKTYLVTQGIEDGRIRAVGYGGVQPLKSNDTEEGRAANRRTEITIIIQ